jgi:hypothetical protein
MSGWWTYRPEDLLLFAPRTYWRLFELHNEAWWPLPLLMPGLFLLLLMLALRGRARPVLLTLALVWAFVGWTFVSGRYAAINWAAGYAVPLVALQAAGLAYAAFRASLLQLDRGAARRSVAGALAGLAIGVYPLLAPLQGRPWTAAEIVGLAPDPTALATLGLLTLDRGPLARWLLVVPVLWCLLAALTLWTMGSAQAWLLLAAIPIALYARWATR